jgi:tRNA threonylcarbamoyladenosine modification (KEOPS) complex  Pcc1 subunit
MAGAVGHHPHRAELRLGCPGPEAARAVADALGVEALEGPDGTWTEARADGPDVVVRVAAQDLAGLRAALHGVVRLVDAACRTLG